MKFLATIVLFAAAVRAQSAKPEAVQAFECYVQSAEARMQASQRFLAADSDSALRDQLVRDQKVVVTATNGSNPHKVTGGLIFDLTGAIFIPGVQLERVIRMLQDYDHRVQYMGEIVSASKLLCRTGEDRFGFDITLKEPAAIETENDVTWEYVDEHRRRYRSYSTKVHELGKQHNYVIRLNSYWRVAETPAGVYIQAETISLSGEIGSLLRTLGAIAGIRPENSLKKTLEQVRQSVLQPRFEFARPPSGLPACGEPVRPAGCGNGVSR
jgi:hypothetical protein